MREERRATEKAPRKKKDTTEMCNREFCISSLVEKQTKNHCNNTYYWLYIYDLNTKQCAPQLPLKLIAEDSTPDCAEQRNQTYSRDL